MRIILACAVMLSGVSGCTTIESQLITKDVNGVYQGQKFNGVPIVITVADKLGFLVTESKYRVTRQSFNADGDLGRKSTAIEFKRTIDKAPIKLGDTKLFTVDVKRPVFGTANTEITLDKDKQYPTKISTEIDDKTLGKIVDNLDKIVGAFKPQSIEDELEDEENVLSRALISQRQYLLIYNPKNGTFRRQKFL